MKRKKGGLLLILVGILLLFSPVVIAGELKHDLEEIILKTPAEEEVPVILLFHKKPMPADISIIKSEGASIKRQYKIINAVAAKVPAKSVDKIAKKAFIKLAEPDYKVKLVLDKSTLQIQADKVWGVEVTGKEIDVAVLDTGIHDEHPALRVEKEIDYTGEGTDDLHGHGTHVAGIIASIDSVYRGVAYDADLFNVKVLNKYGSGYGSDIISGIEWAIENGAEVISMSFGAEIDPCDGTDAISQAVDNAVSQGVVAVVAAGNAGPESGTITSPGCSEKAITVGAVDDSDNIASFSSRGPTDDGRVKPDLVAPGVLITSTWKDNSFVSLSGTSMSTPHVSGVAALLLEADSSLGPSDIKEILKSSALDLGLDENTQGAGRIDAYAAYSSIIKQANITITKFETDKKVVNIDDSFKTILNVENSGNLNAEGVQAVLTLPLGLSTTDNLTKSINEGVISAGANATVEWIVNADEEGEYEIIVDVSSENDGSDSATTIVYVEAEENKTIENKTRMRDLNLTKMMMHGKKMGLMLKAGITPDLFIPYRVKKIFENIDLFLTYDELLKAEKKVKYATKRLVEANEMMEKGKTEFVEELIEEYERGMEEGNEISKIAKQIGKNVTKLTELIAVSTSIHLDVLKEVLEKVPEEAKPAIKRAINVSEKGNKESLELLEEIQPEKATEIYLEIAEEKLKKIKEKSEDEEEEIDDLVKEYKEKLKKVNEMMEEVEDTEFIDGLMEEVTRKQNKFLKDLPDKVSEQIKESMEKTEGVSKGEEGKGRVEGKGDVSVESENSADSKETSETDSSESRDSSESNGDSSEGSSEGSSSSSSSGRGGGRSSGKSSESSSGHGGMKETTGHTIRLLEILKNLFRR
jgi:serine protease AprX